MTAIAPEPPSPARALVRALRAPAIVSAVYLVLRFAFDRATATVGLLAPSGAPHLGVAALGVVVIVARVGVVVLLPPWIGYRLARVALSSRRGPA